MVEPDGAFITQGTTLHLDSKSQDLHEPTSAQGGGLSIKGILMLLGFFGADDAMVPVADVRALERGFASSGSPSEVVVVEGAGHAFMNDTRPEAYRADAARAAWARMVAFLRDRLRVEAGCAPALRSARGACSGGRAAAQACGSVSRRSMR